MALTPPTTAQQRGFAYAQIPFAAISLLSSVYVIQHISCRQRQKLQRLYHRLVLGLNGAVVPLSLSYLVASFPVPQGTPYYLSASGNQQTCTAQGFIAMLFTMTVPFYYASLSLQAYLAIKNGFREDRYAWVEKWIHVIAYAVPLALCCTIAATENFNPGGSGCSMAKAPRGCEGNPDLPCERGQNVDVVVFIFGFGQIALYFIFPPAFATAMYCCIKKLEKRLEDSRGMQRIRVSAKKTMWKSVARQMALYLVSFWGTFIPTLIHFVYKTITGEPIYNLNIFANCVFASQGFVMAAVYFGLERMGRRQQVYCLPTTITSSAGPRRELTVEDIRLSANTKSQNGRSAVEGEDYRINIFCGNPDPNSPWAKYIEQEDQSTDNAQESEP